MTDENILDSAKTTASVVSEIIKVAGDSEEAKVAAKNIGKTAVTVTKTINNILLPLAAVNFAFDKARDYFNNKFNEELQEKTQSIPSENIVNPKGSIAGPTLQGLAFAHEEQYIKEMYLNLLKTAMDNRVSTNAHPAFVEIIKQLTSEEAILLNNILLSFGPTALVQIKSTKKDVGGFNILIKHLMNLVDIKTGEPISDKKVPAMVDNWIRLGLVEVTYQNFLNDARRYDWVTSRPEYIHYDSTINKEIYSLSFDRGLIAPTDLGLLFKAAVM